MAEYTYINPDKQEEVEKFVSANPEPEFTHEFEISVKDFVKAGKASSAIKLFLKQIGVGPQILRRVAISSYEAEINIVAHSLGGKIFAHIHNELIHIVLTDNGPGMDNIEKAMTPGFSTADDLAREMGFGAGLGLPNIKKNSDYMHIVSAKGESTKLEILIYFT